MMNAFFRRAFSEYKRQKELKKAFVVQTARLGSLLRQAAETAELGSEARRARADFHARAALLAVMPLVEIAWADGRVTRREMDAIMEVAETYCLVDDEASYRALVERLLLARPIPNEVGRMWQDFHYFMRSLPLRARVTLTLALLVQAQFVAEQSTESVVGFLRGERICKDEQEALRIVTAQIEKAKNAAEEADVEKYVAAQLETGKLSAAASVFSERIEADGDEQAAPPTPPRNSTHAGDELPATEKTKNTLDEKTRQKMVDALVAAELEIFRNRQREISGADDSAAFDSAETTRIGLVDDSEKLIPLVPLVKVAWAEGRITKRERELIFSAAKRMGIAPGSPSYERLAGWLELHPTDDFYTESLERLNADWENLPEEEKILRRLDLLSDCVNVAEASGGTKRFPAGGQRVCDEELAAVRRIAEKLNAPSNAGRRKTMSLAA